VTQTIQETCRITNTIQYEFRWWDQPEKGPRTRHLMPVTP